MLSSEAIPVLRFAEASLNLAQGYRQVRNVVCLTQITVL